MNRHAFLTAVLGNSGHYCLFGAKKNPRRLVQKFYDTIEELATAADRMNGNGLDTYFALATFDDPEVEKPRAASNAVELRSFFLDLDCGPEKDYDTQTEALIALRAFCKKLGLEKPILVNSGRGVHVYWPLSEPVPRDEWLPIAEALKRACVKAGLRSDPTVPADAARVLRVPGTHNYKSDPPLAVDMFAAGHHTYDLADFKAVIEDFAGATPAPVPDISSVLNPTGLSISDDPVMQRLLQSRSVSFKRIIEKSVTGRGCAQMIYALQNAKKLPEPMWRAALSIANVCTDAEKAAEKLSSAHPDYDRDVTMRKMRATKGPQLCVTIDSHNPGVCEDCPLWGKIKSPVVLGTEIEKAEEVEEEVDGDGEPALVRKDKDDPLGLDKTKIPPYPYPYFRGKFGGVYEKIRDDEGNEDERLVYMNDLYFVRRVHDPEVGECVVGRLHLPHDGIREFVMPLTAATSKEELRKALAKEGVFVHSKGWDAIMSYTNSWVSQLQATAVSDNARRQFGWTNEEFDTFVIGDREIKANAIGYNPPSAATAYLFPAFTKKGTLEGWKEQAEFYDRKGLEVYQFMVCQSLAAPLMRFTPIHGAIFDLFSSGSGLGKTTTQKFALSIYGNPSMQFVQNDDTVNMRMNRLEVMKDINVQFDEFTEFPAEEASKLVYGITSGRQKGRMSAGSNAERFRGDPWHTTVAFSSNESVLSKIRSVKGAPKGESQRVLEFHAKMFPFDTKKETDDFASAVGQHYGHAIEVFIQHVIRNRDTVKALIVSVQSKLDKELGLIASNRFWSTQGTVSIVALILARDAGLLTYDVKGFYKFVVALIRGNRDGEITARMSVDTMLNEYISDHYGSILWIKSTEDLRKGGENGNGLDALAVPEMQPRVRFIGRYETDTKRLYLMPKQLRAWCSKNRIDFDSAIDDMMAQLGGKRMRARIGKGTKMNLPATDVIMLNCEKIELSEPQDDGSKA